MNRFEQPKLHPGRTLIRLLPLLVFLLLLIFFIQGISSVSETTYEKQHESLETALQRSISQCYSVEGVYPPNLDYIVAHYGLTYDDTVFFIDYQSQGGNILPEVTILRRSSSGNNTNAY